MKRYLITVPLIIAVGAILVLSIYAEDKESSTIRYRTGSVLKFDAGSSIKDEDGAWTITQTQMGKLAVMQSGAAANVNAKTVTNTFSPAFSAAPVVVCSAGTNDLPHIVSVSTTNVILGAAQTNATIRWIAIGSP